MHPSGVDGIDQVKLYFVTMWPKPGFYLPNWWAKNQGEISSYFASWRFSDGSSNNILNKSLWAEFRIWHAYCPLLELSINVSKTNSQTLVSKWMLWRWPTEPTPQLQVWQCSRQQGVVKGCSDLLTLKVQEPRIKVWGSNSPCHLQVEQNQGQIFKRTKFSKLFIRLEDLIL